MSAQQPNDPLDDYVANPYTGRLIKKNSKTHRRLVAARLLDEEKPSTPEENLILDAGTVEQAKVLQGKMNKTMQKNKVITRRGTKVLKANRRPTRTEQIDKITEYAVSSVVDNKEAILEQDLTDEEMDKYIRNLIQKRLLGMDVPAVAPPPIPIIKKMTTRQAPLVKQPLRRVQEEEELEEEFDDGDY